MSEQTPKKKSKIGIFAIAGIVALVAIVATMGLIGEKVDERIVDAEGDLTGLQEQVSDLETMLKIHESILQQHNVQILQQANNTNIIAGWAEIFSTNVDDRLNALEGVGEE